jgi:hypothetical protein
LHCRIFNEGRRWQMSLAKPQLDYYIGLLRREGIVDQGRAPARKIRASAILSNDGLTEEEIAEVWSVLPAAPKPADPAPPVKAESPAPERSEEKIAAIFRKAKGEDKPKKPSGLKGEPAKRIELKAENQFRIYHPAPVVAINRYGTVRWVADGRQHKAGQLIEPRAFQGKLTVRFRYQGEQVERLVGHMLETVGWLKRRAKKKAISQ